MNGSQNLSDILGDLEECNNEAIHLSGAIQNHGCTFFFNWPEKRILAMSENAPEFLQFASHQILNGHIGLILEQGLIQTITQIIEGRKVGRGRSLKGHVQGQTYDLYLYETGGLYALEFEKMDLDRHAYDCLADDHMLQEFMDEIKDCRDLREAANKVCAAIRRVTGIDRVMMYKFIPPAWHGEVIGEDRVIGSHSFMNHRFPSSDIPKPARDLYLRNKVRLIQDSNQSFVPLTPAQHPLKNQRWDLSDSRLRSVAPIHLEYLRNMNVQGSMSFAVVVNNELWGLIACHHMESFRLSHAKRAVGSIIANAFASHAALLEVLDSHVSKSGFDSKLRKIIESVIHLKDPVDGLFREHSYLMDIFAATGLALCNERVMDFTGITPPRASLTALCKHIRHYFKTTGRSYLAAQSIKDVFPEWQENLDLACGLLCVALGDEEDSLLMMFRPEVVQVITWGGNPSKSLEKKNFTGRINPRKSFESWEEVIRNQSRAWAPYKIDGAMFLKEVVFEVVAQKNFLIKDLTLNRKPQTKKDEA